MATMNLNQFALALGQHARITREYSLDWHVAYVKADEATQKAWRDDFICHYVMGALDITERDAKKVCAKKRTERDADEVRAFNAGRMQFGYHVVRDSGKVNKAEPSKRYRAPNGLAPVMQDLIKRFGRDELLAYLKAHK